MHISYKIPRNPIQIIGASTTFLLVLLLGLRTFKVWKAFAGFTCPWFQCVFKAFVCFYRPLEIVFVYGLAAHFTAYGFQGFACSRVTGITN